MKIRLDHLLVLRLRDLSVKPSTINDGSVVIPGHVRVILIIFLVKHSDL